MIRRIAPEEAQIGMFVEGFEGSWLDHPFWRRRFRIETPRQLDDVRRSAVTAILVKETPDPAPPAAATPRAATPVPPNFAVRRERPAARRTAPDAQDAPVPVAQEFARAGRIVGRSKAAVGRMFADVRLGKTIRAANLVPLVDDITASIERNPDAFVSIARLKSRHEYTYMHSVAVCALMINLARRLRLGETAVREAGLAGLLHDIGKAAMPVTILDKPGRLDDAEFATIKSHPVRGYELLKESRGVPGSALDVCLRHHERVDGTGYPDGLDGRRLTLFAKMGAICDVYDAITSARAYKDAWNPNSATARMRSWTGHFDEELLDLFIKSIGVYPVGALVALKDETIGIVAATNRADPTRPLVLGLAPRAGRWALAGPVPWSTEISAVLDPTDHGLADFDSLRTRALRQGMKLQPDS